MIQHINNSLGSFISHAGEFFLSQSAQSSRSNFAHSFEPTERLRHTENTEASPPAPLRMERGVVCEVTPFGLLLIADGPLNIWRTYMGYLGDYSPLHSERGWGVRLQKAFGIQSSQSVTAFVGVKYVREES